MNDPIGQIIDLILKSNKILVVPSCPPDGDSIGSALALFEGLKKLDKKVTVVSADPVPNSLRFLPSAEIIGDVINGSRDFIVTLDCNEAQVDKLKYEIVDNKVNIIITPKNGKFSEQHVSFKQSGPDFDLVIAVDTADINQLGSIYQDNTDFFYSVPVINIDHHISNSGFGKINYVDTAASSATEILFEIFKALEQKVQKKLVDNKVATYLLTGILTDTGSFQNPNTTPKSLEASAELVERGAAQQEIIKHVFRTKELSTLKLWGEILSKIETDEKHKMVWSTVTKADFAKANAKTEEVSGLIDDMLVNAPGAEIVFIIKEDEGKIACSMRSTTPAANVSEIAEHFGGGGHVQASGFRLPGANLKEATEEIISYIKQYQAKRLYMEEIPSAQTVMQAPATPQPEKKEYAQQQIPAELYVQKVNEQLLGEKPEAQALPKPIPTPEEAPKQPLAPQQPQLQPQPQPQQAQRPQPQQQQNFIQSGEIENPIRKKRRRKKRRPEGQPSFQPQSTQAQTQVPPPKPPQPPIYREAVSPATTIPPVQKTVQQQAPQQTVVPETFRTTPTPVQQETPEMPPKEPPASQAPTQQVYQQPTPPTQPPTTQVPTPVPPPKPPQPIYKEAPVQEDQKPTFDPFNPPTPDESDILAALDKL